VTMKLGRRFIWLLGSLLYVHLITEYPFKGLAMREDRSDGCYEQREVHILLPYLNVFIKAAAL
jgi:hypothetical protein